MSIVLPVYLITDANCMLCYFNSIAVSGFNVSSWQTPPQKADQDSLSEPLRVYGLPVRQHHPNRSTARIKACVP